MNVEPVVAIIGGVLIIAGLLGASGPVFRSSRTKATLDLQETMIVAERSARLAQEERCKVEIAELRGQVQNMRLDYAKQISRDVIRFVREELLDDVS